MTAIALIVPGLICAGLIALDRYLERSAWRNIRQRAGLRPL
jgi:hypothetical protein